MADNKGGTKTGKLKQDERFWDHVALVLNEEGPLIKRPIAWRYVWYRFKPNKRTYTTVVSSTENPNKDSLPEKIICS